MLVQTTFRKLSFVILALLSTLTTFAQNGGTDINVDINKGGGNSGNWYSNPIVWVIGAAVFILLLVALLRGNKRA